jgi:hypothetical protein
MTKEGRVLGNERSHPSFMTTFVHLFIKSVIRRVAIVTLNTHMTLNIMFSVVQLLLNFNLFRSRRRRVRTRRQKMEIRSSQETPQRPPPSLLLLTVKFEVVPVLSLSL